MSINLDKFAKINIVESTTTQVNSTRDVVILFYDTLDTGLTAKTYGSLEEMYGDAIVEYNEAGYASKSDLYKYAYIYFRSGGLKLKLVQANLASGAESRAVTKEQIESLERNEIVVASVLNDLSSIANSLELEGPNQKILLGCSNSASDTTEINSYIVKYSAVTGAEMSIAAYLSKINVYTNDSVRDYAYTKELEMLNDSTIQNSTIDNIIANDYNADIKLANAVRNIGGNMKNGLDLVNHYVLIILHQTLQDRLVDLLSQKIKGTAGISAIYSTMSDELNRYLSAGYLVTDKLWNKDTLSVVKNGITYTIIERNQPISLGYNITILPLTSLTPEEAQQHRAPYIYVVLATSYGFRYIEVNGEAI